MINSIQCRNDFCVRTGKVIHIGNDSIWHNPMFIPEHINIDDYFRNLDSLNYNQSETQFTRLTFPFHLGWLEMNSFPTLGFTVNVARLFITRLTFPVPLEVNWNRTLSLHLVFYHLHWLSHSLYFTFSLGMEWNWALFCHTAFSLLLYESLSRPYN